MKYILSLVLTLSFYSTIMTQTVTDTISGNISYITAQNIYVKFESTKGLSIGDTIYLPYMPKDIAILKVKNLSSISSICEPISKMSLFVSDKVYCLKTVEVVEPAKVMDVKKEMKPNHRGKKHARTTKKIKQKKESKAKNLQRISGRISTSSYANFSNKDPLDNPRMRYTFSLRGTNIKGSKFGVESYISFKHKLNEWDAVKNDFRSALKVYNIAVSYNGTKNSILFGRKINSKIANIGATDGFQFMHSTKRFTFGAIAGYRPDQFTYWLNLNLPQFGIYAQHRFKSRLGSMQNTFGVFEQEKGGKVDRRFAYFQHTNTLNNNIYIFFSGEFDLYKKVEGNVSTIFKPTSLYFSLRYKIRRNLSLFAAYDNRTNVIYYETYKNTIDQLIEQETRQGFRLRVNYRPFRAMSIGLGGIYRFQKDQLAPTKNVNAYINFSRIPFLKASSSLSYTYLDTYYLTSHIGGIRFNKSLIKGKVYSTFHYRYIYSQYKLSTSLLQYQIAGININWKILKHFSLSLNYEMTLQKSNTYHRTYIKLIKRF